MTADAPTRAPAGAQGAPPDPAPPAARHGRAAVVFIFVTVMLDMMALGMVAPVLPRLVAELLVGTQLSGKLAHHLPQGTVSTAAVIFGLFNTVFALMQFFFSPLIGSLSDRFGRRPLILASNIGLGLNYALMAWAPNLWWLFLGRVISGITGASFGTASAYIADVTPVDKRAGAFGLLGAAFGVGFMFGPALGGLLGEISPRLPFIVAAGFSVANALYGLIVLPESLPQALRSGFSWKRANPVGALVLLRRHPELQSMAGVLFLSNLAQVSLPSIVVLYVSHRYGWTPGAIGLTLAMVGVALAVVQIGVVGRFVGRFGNRRALVTGLIFGALGLGIAGLANTSVGFWAGIPVIALWGLSGAAGQGIMTRHVEASEQGQLQGANASLTGIAELIGPSLFSLTFAWFVRPGLPPALAGAPFILAAGLLALATFWAWIATRRESDRDQPGPGEGEPPR